MAYKVKNTCVQVEVLVMGMLDNNVYIVDDGQACFVVDPSTEPRRILNALGDRVPEAIVLTHGHWDHIGAAAALREETGATVIASVLDGPVVDGTRSLGDSHRRFRHCPVDKVVDDGDVVEIGSMKWQIIMTPGHTPGSMCLFLDSQGGGDDESKPVLISGDTLFCGTHGRTDFEGGSPAAMRDSLKRLSKLPEDTIVLPGHNNLTTIAHEAWWLERGGM